MTMDFVLALFSLFDDSRGFLFREQAAMDHLFQLFQLSLQLKLNAFRHRLTLLEEVVLT